MADALEHLDPEPEAPAGRALLVCGDSGAGKTFFVRELLRRLGGHMDGLFLYIDVADDEYQSSRAIASLLKMALVPGPMTATSVISVPDSVSLARYRGHTRHRRTGRGLVRALAEVVSGFFGVGKLIAAAIDDTTSNSDALLEDELAAYLAWVAKRRSVVIAVDNIQFLNLDTRLTIESVLQRVGHRLRAILVNRTIDGISGLNPPVRCFANDLLTIDLGLLSQAQTRQVVASALGDAASETDRLAADIFAKTAGLPKDVEYCLRRYTLKVGDGARAGAIEGLLATIDRLPLMHRQFLIIAALLRGGVKRPIAQATVRRLASLSDETELDQALDDLIASEYLRMNTDSGDRLRPAHERVATAMRELTDDDLHEEVRRSLIQELVEALEGPDGLDSETYLLHCLVGLQTARELARNLHLISRLIQSQFRQDQFSYLVSLSAELQDVVPLLPEYIVTELLDAMQKSSAFDQGLQLVKLLDAEGVPGAQERKVYRLKYLAQAYQYDEALALSEEIGNDGWGAVYRINTLMSLERNAEARALADLCLSTKMSECQAVLRRNTVTLFDSETALRHLEEAEQYFRREGSDFRLATVGTNRSLVYLHLGQFGDALRSLEGAVDRMRRVGSGEIFQAQMNLAVRSALLGDYEAALRWLDEAYVRVPRPLLLDQVKIKMDRVVVESVAGSLDAATAIAGLDQCVERIRGVQMPEVRNALISNYARFGVVLPGGPADGSHVKGALTMTIVLEPPMEPEWTLLMSAHWRY